MSKSPFTPHSVASPEQTRWFADEVQAHEPLLKAYLRGSFPSVRDVDDIVQESYLRIWRARLGRPIRSAKAFLFQVARNLAIDSVRRSQSSPTKITGDLASLSVLEEGPDAAEALSYHEKVCRVAEALSALPRGSREVIILCKFQCLPYKEAAVRLGVSERTVESQLSRGMKLCERYLRRHGIHGFTRDER